MDSFLYQAEGSVTGDRKTFSGEYQLKSGAVGMREIQCVTRKPKMRMGEDGQGGRKASVLFPEGPHRWHRRLDNRGGTAPVLTAEEYVLCKIPIHTHYVRVAGGGRLCSAAQVP